MNTPFPTWNGLHPSLPPVSLWSLRWLKWLSVCLSCLLAFSVCLFVSKFPPVLSLSSAKMYALIHSTSILIQIWDPSKVSETYDPQHSLSEELDRECWRDRQTFYGLLVFCLSRALPSLYEWQLLAYTTYAHVANARLRFGPCVPSPHF